MLNRTLTMCKQWLIIPHKKHENCHYHFIIVTVLMWSVFDRVQSQIEETTVNPKKKNTIQPNQASELSRPLATDIWVPTLKQQQQTGGMETEPTAVIRNNSQEQSTHDSIHHTKDDEFISGTVNNIFTFTGTAPILTVKMTHELNSSNRTPHSSAVTESTILKEYGQSSSHVTESDKFSWTIPSSPKPVAGTDNCIQCNWTQIHSHITPLKEPEGRVEWIEPVKSCWCIHELSWYISPAQDNLGIVLHFTHFSFKWYERLEVYAGDRHDEDKLLFRHPFLTTAVLFLPHGDLTVWVRTMPWPFVTVEYAPSSFIFNYSTHPLHLLPTAVSRANMTFRRVAPLVAEDVLYDCSTASIPPYILCDKVQQCVGGEDEPVDCPYRSVSCGHHWFLHHDRCLQIVITSTKDVPQPCDQQSGGKPAVLPVPSEPELLSHVVARTGISAVCLAVDLTYKRMYSRSIQMKSQYQHIWQWGQGIMNHGDQPQRNIPLDSKFALYFSHGKVSTRTVYGSECDHKTTAFGFLCMKDRVLSTVMGGNSPRTVRLHLPLNSKYNDSTTTLPPTDRLKKCSDGSLVLPFQQCRQNNTGLSWSPNNFKLFHCILGGPVHYALVCDGHSDCVDGSDETGCNIPTDISILQSYHVCANGQLIALNKKNYMCDGAIDCLDQSDERLCTSCAEGTILCPGFGCRPPSYTDLFSCTGKKETLYTTDSRFPKMTSKTPSLSAEGQGVDLVIILHSTSALTDNDYQFIKEQLTLMLGQLNSSSTHIRLGFMVFDSQAHVHFMLKDLNSIAENYLENVTLTSSRGTNIAGALHMSRTEMFSAQNGDRSDVPNVILLITAAVSDVNSSDVIRQADKVKGQGIHILVLGVGITDTQELRSIVSWPLEETLFLTMKAVGVGQPLYKIAFALLPLGKLPLLLDKDRKEVMNIALNKPTANSHYADSSHDSGNGVDGNLYRCVFITGQEPYPHRWWRVDLLELFEIDSIIITNGAYWLSNFYVFVTTTTGEPLDDPQNLSGLCLYRSKCVDYRATVHLHCTKPIRGRYVTLVKYNSTNDLIFCEVAVLGIPVQELSNVALYKPSAMSTYHRRYGAENSVDGFIEPGMWRCSHTADYDTKPYRWWSADLQGVFKIYSILISNRRHCCAHHLSNFYIFVTMTSVEPSDSPTKTDELCLYVEGNFTQRSTMALPCLQPMKGRYVTVLTYNSKDPLSFCELEVLGAPLLENWNPPQRIYPPAVLHMDGLGLSIVEELEEGQENCPDTHFQCVQGFCIPTYLLNNGIMDCPYEDDENIADLSCPDFFRCWITGNCLHPVYYCDGVNHCPFNEDERYCGQEHCPEQCVCEGQAFHCQSGFNYQAHFQLRYLDLSGSNNPDLKDIEFLTYLQYLNLSSCDMVEVKLSSLSQLRILDVSRNSIHSFDLLKLNRLSELLHLNLSFNPLSKLIDPDFSNFVSRSAFTALQSLVMVDVGLETITTKGLTGSTQISALDIRQNPVGILPTKVFGKSIRVLYTDNLRLCCHHFHMTQLAECHSPVDELSSCKDLLKSDFLRVLLWILSVMALIGNVGVWVYRTFIEQQGTSMAYKVMVINLSASDFLMGVYMAIIGVADMTFRDIYVLKEELWRHTVACKIAGFLAILSSEMSAFVICLITLDRFLLLRFPFSLHLRLSKWSASVACCITWLAAVMLAILPLFVSHWKFYSQNSICVPLPITQCQFPGQHYAFGVFIVLNCIIACIIGVGQVFIYHTIRQSSRGLQKDSRNQEIAIAQRLILIVVTDFCCWFPIGLMGLLAAQGTHISDLVNVWAGVFVLPLNSALNPFLYTLNTFLERRAKHVEQKRIEKIMTNIHLQMRTWPSQNMLEHVRKCCSLGLLAKEDVLELAAHCPEPHQLKKEGMAKLTHGRPDQ